MVEFETQHAQIDQWLAGVLPLARLRQSLIDCVDQHAAALESRAPAFRSVLDQLLMRIEGAASFTEESCSFSQGDFAASLHDWLGKLQARVGG